MGGASERVTTRQTHEAATRARRDRGRCPGTRGGRGLAIALGLVLGTVPATSPAGAREIAVEVVASPRTGLPCRATLTLYPDARARAAARRPHLIEAAAIALFGHELARHDLDAAWDGVAFSLTSTGRCPEVVAAMAARWRGLGEAMPPTRVIAPALSPPALVSLRRSAGRSAAAALGLGASEVAATDLDLTLVLVDALAEAPAWLRVESASPDAARSALDAAGLRGVRPRPPPPAFTPGPRLLPPGPDGMTRFWVAFRLAPDVPGHALATLLDHPGHRLVERLAIDMGLVHTLTASWLDGPALLVFEGALPGPGHLPAIERLLIELGQLGRSLARSPASEATALRGLAMLEGEDDDALALGRSLGEVLIGLTQDQALIVVEPARDDLERQVSLVTTELILRWTAATMDLRCPAPDETRERNTLLAEEHDLDARRYLAISRALGRDAERMRQLDRELIDRCEEDKKLRRMMPLDKVVALHRQVRCGRPPGARPDDPAEVKRLRAIFARARLDSSTYRPLLAMARRSLPTRDALAAIDERCPEAR